ncbi:MAG: hypothetical protein ACXVA9_07490 [Bdellovibrionales bacterium]
MKKIIAISAIAMFASLTTIAGANAQTVLAEVGTVSQQVKAVQLLDNGVLAIYGYGRTTAHMQLSKSNAATLLGLAKGLAEVKLTTTHQDFICMMLVMESPFTSQELSILANDGSMRKVLTNNSCAVADHTFPQEDYNLQMAKDLKDQLIVLAHQLAND